MGFIKTIRQNEGSHENAGTALIGGSLSRLGSMITPVRLEY
jgi:hypothetical protein